MRAPTCRGHGGFGIGAGRARPGPWRPHLGAPGEGKGLLTIICTTLVFLLLATPPLAAAQDGVGADEAAIEQIYSVWNEAIRAKDAEAVAALYAEDAVKLVPNLPLLEGRQEIEGYYAGLFEVPDFQSTFGPTRIVVADGGDLAYDYGTYTASWTGEAGPAEEVGKYVSVWRRIDGDWRLAVDMDNPDPAPAE